MPAYEYRCRDCGERFDINVPCHLKPNHPPCSNCKSDNTLAVFSAYIVSSRNNDCNGCKNGNCGTCR